MKASELFLALRKKAGGSQEEVAPMLKMSVRSWQMYEGGEYDKSNLSPVVIATIKKAEELLKTLDNIPTQKGDNENIANNLIAIRTEVKEIRDRLLATIESQARTIEALSKKH